MNLSFNGQLRTESDESVIAALLRKGWIETNPPEFDSSTHQASWVDGDWVISVIPKEVPTEVPLWAFRAMLAVSGIAAQVDGLIVALPEPQRTVASTQWVYGNFIVRNHPMIEALGSQLGLTADQIDDIFIQASKLA